MKRLGYFIALPFIYFISVMPFPLLYALSDALYFLLYWVIGYRKEIVIGNLQRAFPEKSPDDLRQIAMSFYRYLCDLTLETLKTLTISPQGALKHCYMDPASIKLMDQLYAENKNVILVLGHYGNWEWAGNAFSLTCKHPLYVIYHPLSNSYFDQLMIKIRTRFGTKLIAMKETFRKMTSLKSSVSAFGFIADQTPSPEGAFWTTFLHQDTPVFKGTELMASRFKYEVVFISIKRHQRGRYEVFASASLDGSKAMQDGAITLWHTQLLEKQIIEDPSIWLWSHKRWKHTRPPQ